MKIFEASIVYRVVAQGEEVSLDDPAAVVRYLRGAFDTYPLQEQFIVIPLNRKNRPFGRIAVTVGTASSALVHPREAFRPAILAGASAIIVSHNHPSGNPAPSSADLHVTRQLREAGNIIGIDLIDHIIIGEAGDDPGGKGYYSFSEAGAL